MARELLLSYMLLLLTSRLAAENSSAVSSTRRAAESLHLLHRGKDRGKEGSNEMQQRCSNKGQTARDAPTSFPHCHAQREAVVISPCPLTHISRCRVMRRRYCSGGRERGQPSGQVTSG